MKKLKVAIIGAGSTYTPELIQGFISRRDVLAVDELAFMDIDVPKMEIVAGLARRMYEAQEMHPKIVLTDRLPEAVEGADYVIGQVRVGGLSARIRDEKIPLKYGMLGQETTGAGGFMNALRTLPVLMNVTKAMSVWAPRARLINFSNPSGIIAEALLNFTDIQTVGLCNGPINMVRQAMRRVPDGTAVMDYDFVGLNHLNWICGIHADGKEILQEQLAAGSGPTESREFDAPLLKAVGAIPCSYLQYYYHRQEAVKKCLAAAQTRGEVCVEIEDELLRLYQDPELREKPAVLDKRGGALYSEAAVSLMDAWENDKNEIHVVNVKNQAAYRFMAWDDVVEVKCRVGQGGAAPIPLTPSFGNPHIIGLMQAVKAYEKLTVKAGLEGDRNAALQALLVHPLIGDYDVAKSMLDEMLEANRAYLPQFFKR